MSKTEERECNTHGLTTFVYRASESRWRCRACSVDAVASRRKKVKLLAIEYMGGSCLHCGYDKCVDALEFHHTNPEEKDFGISSKGYTRSFEKVKKELDKCVMLCANCHREEHARLMFP